MIDKLLLPLMRLLVPLSYGVYEMFEHLEEDIEHYQEQRNKQ